MKQQQSEDPDVSDLTVPESEIRGSVTIFHQSDGSVILVPQVGLIDRHIQTVLWSLVVGDTDIQKGVRFADVDGIQYVSGWPPEAEKPVRLNDWQYSANVNFKIPDGELKQTYKYNINVVDSTQKVSKIENYFSFRLQRIDPDMENEPRP